MKIGDYVRIDGYISKIEHIKKSSSGKIYAQWKQPNGLLVSGNIKIIEKSSPNIIDLIEEGDYVNGHYVKEVEKVPNEEVYKVIRTSTCDGMDGETLDIYKEEIESIVTKEAFENMEYKVGDE